MQIRKNEIRKKIEKAARESFLDKGFLNASMRYIAEKAKISTSNLYTYFPSKEDLFHSLISSSIQEINKLQQRLIETEKKIGREQLFSQITKLVAEPIGELIKNHRVEFLLLLDKSHGTKYEGFKNNLIKLIENHFLEDIYSQPNLKTQNLKDDFVFHIIATNFVEGLLEIVRHYEDDNWIDSSINALMQYHINGIQSFM